MKSCIAILTFRRLNALKTMMAGVDQHCPQYRCAVFEDCGQRDDTSRFLSQGRALVPRKDLLATQWTPTDNPSCVYPNAQVFLGDVNLGVAGNSNRALRWFMEETDCDHLCLCNDDLHIDGDFVRFYAKAHQDLSVGFWCFTDFTHHESYATVPHPWRGYVVKMMPRITGIMISLMRAVVEKIGYFDTEFGKFGQEHVDYTHRARFGGFIRIENQDVNCVDVEHKLLRHQDVPTSLTGGARARADQYANEIIRRSGFEYAFRHYYRPFRLISPVYAGAYFGSGVSCRQLEQLGYRLVTGLV